MKKNSTLGFGLMVVFYGGCGLALFVGYAVQSLAHWTDVTLLCMAATAVAVFAFVALPLVWAVSFPRRQKVTARGNRTPAG